MERQKARDEALEREKERNNPEKKKVEEVDTEMFEDVGDEGLTSVVVVKHASLLAKGLGQAISIYIPEGYSLSLLRRFIYSGCKAIGEREEHKLMMECGKRVFPEDYPGTNTAKLVYHDNALRFLEEKYCPRPPSKRVNF